MRIVTTGHRQGFTLAETLIASTVSISLITLSAGFVHIAMFASDSARENYECGRTLARFSDVFRHDVHTALRVSRPGDDEHRIVLELDGGHRINYKIDGSRLVRIEESTPGATHRDEFAFPGHSQLALEMRNKDRVLMSVRWPKLIGKKRMAHLPESTTAWRRVVIEAALGRDHRFSPTGGT
jgi:type II secretory pathway component PulJ